jgi:hypothetical protein
MKYFLWRAVLGNSPRLPLSESEYDALADAWKTIVAVLPFEEEFDSLLQNYIDLELAFLSTAMRSMVLSQNSMVEMRRVRLTFSRHLSNLLASCRSYLDHSPHYLRTFGTEVADSFCDQTKQAYDAEFAYRFMEALRNYAQHRGSPLHGTTFHSRRVERGPERDHLQFSVWASIDLKKLAADKKFKRSVIDEIASEARVDVIGLCRIYIEKLAELHANIRKQLNDKVADSKALVRSAVDRYETETGQDRIGITFARSRSDRTVDHHQDIPEDVIELLESLVSENRQLINLRHRFVSSELLPERRLGLNQAK